MFHTLGTTDLPLARRLIELCLESGVTFFDTSDEYSAGRAEELLGEALGPHRDSVLIATTVGTSTGPGPNDSGLSRHHLIRACEDSLRRLGTDYIDLYQLHAWDGLTPLEETLAAVRTLVESGKVRYVGACNFAAWQFTSALHASHRLSLPRLVSHQVHYSLENRDAEYEIIPAALFHDVAILAWGPLAGGFLTGKYRRGHTPPRGARHSAGWDEPPIRDRDRLYDLIDLLVAIADGYSTSAARVALAWLLARPGVASVVIGARTEAQLRDDLAATDLRISPSEHARLDALSRVPLPYPAWHQLKIARLSQHELSILGPYATDRPMPSESDRESANPALPS